MRQSHEGGFIGVSKPGQFVKNPSDSNLLLDLDSNNNSHFVSKDHDHNDNNNLINNSKNQNQKIKMLFEGNNNSGTIVQKDGNIEINIPEDEIFKKKS